MKHQTRRQLRLLVYRWQQTIAVFIVGYVTNISMVNAVTLFAEIEAGRSGIVGSTEVVTSTLTGPLGESSSTGPLGISSISQDPAICSLNFDSNTAIATSGVTGFTIKSIDNNQFAGVLLADGTAKWKRKVKNGVVVNGTITYQQGRWTNTWWPAINGHTQSKSQNNGNSPYAQKSPFCPNVPEFTIWDPSYERSSSLSVRFLIDAPPGGLRPGMYKFPLSIIHADYSLQIANTKTEPLVDMLNIAVKNYSCSIAAPSFVDLNDTSHTATMTFVVVCNNNQADVYYPVSTWVSMIASGDSANIGTRSPQELGVKGSNGLLTIRGNWSDKPPADCSNSSMYFDGRDGIKLGELPSRPNMFWLKTASFRLCRTGSPPPGEYTAQATLWVVQK